MRASKIDSNKYVDAESIIFFHKNERDLSVLLQVTQWVIDSDINSHRLGTAFYYLCTEPKQMAYFLDLMADQLENWVYESVWPNL